MPVHIGATLFGGYDYSTLATLVATVGTAYGIKGYSSGRKCIWEREWGGKLIMIAAAPTPTTLALMDNLLRLPSPPQILYLPPYESPLPESLLTILHTLRLGATSPLAQLHCEAMPRTPAGVREFVGKWSSPLRGTAGEGGRRVDAIVLGGGWECDDGVRVKRDIEREQWEDPPWTVNQFHFHLVTALLPSLLRAPPERNIRIIQLVSPGWSAALPAVQAELEGGAERAADTGKLAVAARRGVTSLAFQSHLRLILDTLASASYGKKEVVPTVDGEGATLQKRDESVQSNILALSVIMPWAREEVVRPVWGAGSTLRWLLYLLLLPIVVLLTPGPPQAIQPILFALSAPVKFPGDDAAAKAEGNAAGAVDADAIAKESGKSKPKGKKDNDDVEPCRAGVRQGDVVRACAVVDMPPFLHDPLLARATYDGLEAEVKAGVKASELRKKAFPRPMPAAAAAATADPGPPRETTVKFVEP